jgi:transcriptional regulator with XRE-family HTH domain
MTDELLGERIKEIRKQRGMTLQNMADKTGLSIAFISKVERGLTSPTFSALLEICKALEVDLANLAQPSEELYPLIKKNGRIQMFPLADAKIKHEFGTQGSRKIKALWITLASGTTDVSRGHPEEELGIVVQGVLKVTVGKDIFVVEEGDTLYIESHVPHSDKFK